nr:MAG TPA_asm: hypothetical protein [Caudoviricetes sp.]
MSLDKTDEIWYDRNGKSIPADGLLPFSDYRSNRL